MQAHKTWILQQLQLPDSSPSPAKLQQYHHKKRIYIQSWYLSLYLLSFGHTIDCLGIVVCGASCPWEKWSQHFAIQSKHLQCLSCLANDLLAPTSVWTSIMNQLFWNPKWQSSEFIKFGKWSFWCHLFDHGFDTSPWQYLGEIPIWSAVPVWPYMAMPLTVWVLSFAEPFVRGNMVPNIFANPKLLSSVFIKYRKWSLWPLLCDRGFENSPWKYIWVKFWFETLPQYDHSCRGGMLNLNFWHFWQWSLLKSLLQTGLPHAIVNQWTMCRQLVRIYWPVFYKLVKPVKPIRLSTHEVTFCLCPFWRVTKYSNIM